MRAEGNTPELQLNFILLVAFESNNPFQKYNISSSRLSSFVMESETITILLVGDERCGKSTFLSLVNILNDTAINCI